MIAECARKGIGCRMTSPSPASMIRKSHRRFSPSITTIRVPRYEIGRVAGKLILDKIAGNEPEGQTIDLGFELVRRQSA
jgi:LacI family transcriptional regulator, gluconate utilization system Gnt-I transcriptional repressor